MKKNRILFIVAFVMFIMLPNVNAQNSNYSVETKNLEDYMCEEVKGHALGIFMQRYEKIGVSDKTNGKNYLIDFSNIGVCKEYSEDDLYDNYIPTEYSWDGGNLYLKTYSPDFLTVYAKTLDKEIDIHSSYAELEENGFHYVDNPTAENLLNYYEVYYFELSTGEYDENASYYEIKTYRYTTNNFNGEYELATSKEVTNETYEPNKYYVIANPIKKELIGQFNSDTFNVPKDKTGLTSDLTLSKFDFNYHFEIGNKKYYVFEFPEEQSGYFAIFDENGNYQSFGLNNLLIMSIFGTDDNKYLSFLAKVDDQKYIALFDENLNMMVLYDVNQYGDDISFVGYNENKFYYLSHYYDDKILEINYFGDADKYKVVFDANGGKFGNDTIYAIDNWNANLYDSLKEPTREGYTFKGYYTEKTGGTKFEMILNESGIDSDMVFYAQWIKEEKNPQTYDGIVNIVLMGSISLIGLSSALIYFRKRNKVRN